MESEDKIVKFWEQISREVRTPLDVIAGMSSIWKNEIYDIDNVKKSFAKIEECSNKLLKVVNNIVDYSAIEKKQLKIVNGQIDIEMLFNNLSEKYYLKSKNQGKFLNVFTSGTITKNVIGDEERVRQIMECLLDNSVKYSSKMDELNLTLSQKEIDDKDIILSVSLTTSSSILYDNLGVTVGEKVVTEKTDIELHNCFHILTLMGGKIDIILNDNNSSEINIDFKLERDNDNLDDKEEEVCKNNRIIIVSDNIEWTRNRCSVLDELNITYDIAVDDADVLDKIGEAEDNSQPYSICIVDCYLSTFSIKNFVNDIHTIFGKEMVLVTSVFDVENQKEDIVELGIDYVINKIWFKSTILNLLKSINQGQHREKNVEETEADYYNFLGKKVLVAEDALLNFEVVLQMLTKVNIDVTHVEDGMAVVEEYQNKADGYYDCILMDINMPKLNGYEATKRIRLSKKTDADIIPIFAMTANAFNIDIKESLDAGMNGHLAKPLNRDVLYRALNKVFSSNSDKSAFKEGNVNAKEELLSKSEIDSLTGLLNKHGFERKISKLEFSKNSVGFMLVDIDCFREVNETFGYDMGDRIIVKVADIMNMKFRTSDSLIRLEGDKFAILLNNYSGNIDFVKRKVSEMNDYLLKPEDGLPPVCISVGVAFSSKGYSQKLYKEAENALQKVKENGGCDCHIYISEGEEKENNLEAIGYKAFYGTEIYFVEQDNGMMLEKKEKYLEEILGNNHAVGMICGYYEDGMPVYSVSGFMLKNIGYTYDEFLKETKGKFANVVYEDDLDYLYGAINDKDISSRKVRLVHKNGDVMWFNETNINASLTNGRKVWIASFRSVDDGMVSNLCDMDYEILGLIDCNENVFILEKGTVVLDNVELLKRKKYNYQSLIEKVFSKTVKSSEREDFFNKTKISNLRENLESKGMYEFICYNRQQDNSFAAMRYKFRYLDGQQDIIVCTQEYVHRWAESDDITELMNEKGFARKVSEIINYEENADKEYTILFFDIKGFKRWNEMLGHNNSNLLLKNVAEELEKSTLLTLATARLSEDHFGMLIDNKNMDYDEIKRLCDRKIEFNGNSISLMMHCGIYHIDDRKQEPRYMCDKAMIAEMQIENGYATHYFEFNKNLEEKYLNQIFVLNNLERAFEEDEFTIYYQPVYSTKERKIASAEALVRWHCPGRKIISPGVFIPVMEKKGYITKLDLFMAKGVQKFLEDRAFDGKKYVPVSMNLSRMDFLNTKLMSELIENLSNTRLDRDYLRFEVTESAYVDVSQEGILLLNELRKQGNKIYIDDFGTGASSFESLLLLDFDILKIDMMFARQIGKNKVAEEIIKNIISLCHGIGKKVIAEGVETEEQYQFILDADCDYIQGYYFSKPLSEIEFVELLDREE